MIAEFMATKRHKKDSSGTENHPCAYRRHARFAGRRIFAPFCGQSNALDIQPRAFLILG
jgi:hypothetical protein